MNNEPQKQEGNVMDSVFGDGTKGERSPLDTVREFFNFNFVFGMGAAALGTVASGLDAISNSLEGGGLEVGATAAQSISSPALSADMGIKNPSMGMS